MREPEPLCNHDSPNDPQLASLSQSLRAVSRFRGKFAAAGDPEIATKRTMKRAVLLGLDNLAGGTSAFLNCTHDLIVDGFPRSFPRK